MARTKAKSEFVSGLATSTDILRVVSDEVHNLGGSDDNLRRIIGDRGLARQIAQLLVPRTDSSEPAYPLAIDYGQDLATMVQAGNYDYAHPDITDRNFPVGAPAPAGEAKVEAVLVHFDRSMSSQQVLDELGRRGLRPATMVELLAFGAQHPDSQRRFPIVALGSVWASRGGYRYVGCLWESPGCRELGLAWFDRGWGAFCRFLAVRK